jgi:iron complex transport system permease protein
MPANRLFKYLVLLFILVFLFGLNLSLGQVSIPIKKIALLFFGESTGKESWDYIIYNFRLPKAIVAILVGLGLSVSGLLMQTLFRNPLAGPYVMGLSSGSSLGVAFVILGSNFLPSFVLPYVSSSLGIVIASCLGSFLVLLLVLLVSKKLKDTNAILIVGLMFSSFTSAIVSTLTYFSTAEKLQKFTFWSMGSLGNLTWPNILILTFVVTVGLALSFYSLKALDGLLLGENYAKSMGINIAKYRRIILIATSILAGSITAFVGPIAFIGLAVPHLAKIFLQTSNHKVLFVSTLFIGAAIMLLCDVISQMPGANFTLPINAVTSLFGAPIVIWLLAFQKKIR